MGILNSAAETGLSAVGLGGIFKRKTDPKGFGPDFPNGFLIQEIVDGKITDNANGRIELIGSFMPLIPFEYGGKQQVVKDYYPGNPEPVMQVLGSRENDVTIHGKFKTKRFKDTSLKAAAENYTALVDAMRRRGNVVKITLGEWRRYAIIDECAFKLTRLTEIEYSITFSIIGLTLPKNCKIINGADDDVAGSNSAIISAAANALASAKNYPASMPRSLSDALNDLTGGVASAVKLVTGFVDGALKDIENLNASAHRAVGLIKNARTTISQFGRRIGQIQLSLPNLTSGITSDSYKTAAYFNNASHLKAVVRDYSNLAALLASLQARFASLARTIPMRRHLVRNGETLQKLAIKYYNDAEQWKLIYDHNKLTTSALVIGVVLEIPRP